MKIARRKSYIRKLKSRTNVMYGKGENNKHVVQMYLKCSYEFKIHQS